MVPTGNLFGLLKVLHFFKHFPLNDISSTSSRLISQDTEFEPTVTEESATFLREATQELNGKMPYSMQRCSETIFESTAPFYFQKRYQPPILNKRLPHGSHHFCLTETLPTSNYTKPNLLPLYLICTTISTISLTQT